MVVSIVVLNFACGSSGCVLCCGCGCVCDCVFVDVFAFVFVAV